MSDAVTTLLLSAIAACAALWGLIAVVFWVAIDAASKRP
jgi:hypothetical protein